VSSIFTNGATINESGGDYPSFGYNSVPTPTTGVYKYNVTDFASRLQLSTGGFVFWTAPSGTAAANITYTNVFQISQAGTATMGGTLNAGVLNATSDRNKKTDIVRITDAEHIIASLNGVRFNWKKDGTASAGLIAQDVEAVLPEAVATTEDGTKHLNYNAIIGALVEAVKELTARVKALEAR
jgi:hypothetical protein